MALWLEMLNLASQGNHEEATKLLNFELPLALCGTGKSRGPLASALARFIATLPDSERGFAGSRSDDLLALALDALRSSIQRSINLLRFCHSHSDLSLDGLASSFNGWEGLKRSTEDRRQLIADYLRSMLNEGVSLPDATVNVLAAWERTHPACSDPSPDLTRSHARNAKYHFSEVALAKGWDFEWTWRDFKRRNELDRDYSCVDDSESDNDPEAGAEGFDYGVITSAQVILRSGRRSDPDASTDFLILGQKLSPDLTALIERRHASKPGDGYRPIAWHNVFWDTISEFEALALELETRDPLCDTDRELAAHICEHYPEAGKPSRVTVSRRRKSLSDECRAHVINALLTHGGLNLAG
jgi:hypothetical protein